MAERLLLGSASVALVGIGGRTQTRVDTESEGSGVVGGLARVRITPEDDGSIRVDTRQEPGSGECHLGIREAPLTSCASSGCLEGDGIHVLLTRWRSWQMRAGACVKGSTEGWGVRI